MANRITNVVNRLFNLDEDNNSRHSSLAKEKLSNLIGENKQQPYNPFLNKEGKLINEHIDYQKVLNDSNVSQKAKQYITQATGLTPTQIEEQPQPQVHNTAQERITAEVVSPKSNQVMPSSTTTVNTSTSGNTLVDSAKKFIGTPYVWGGESPAEGGMDCSGFVYNALKGAGYNVGRTTAQGYRAYGTKVSRSDMQAGDLVFFGNGKATHIGIYIGDGKMIHSSGDDTNTKSNPGKGVSIANVNYRKDFLEARRV